jgi:spore coat protein CotH
MHPRFIMLACGLLCSFLLPGQPAFPPNSPVFDSAVVARIDISIHPDTLQWIYDNVESDMEFRAGIVFSNGTIQDTLEETGFRLRGNTSRYSRKKSFSVSFNAFRPGREFYGMEKINLNGEHNDPSIIRARICWEWLRAFGLPVPRSAHGQVYINGDYYGLYIIVEHIDEEFAGSRFGNKDGNLYKCLWPADLDYLGANPDEYKLESGSRRVYDLMTNTEADDYTDLARFIDVLNNTSAEDLACALDAIFNLDDYLKIAAMDVITGNWDGYIYNKNNFYLYHNTATGKFEYIPYDLDNTLGIDWMDRDWGTRNIYDWQQHGNESRPLYARIMENDELRDRYTYYMEQLIGMLADEDSLFQTIDQARSMISPSVVNDPYYPLDYGYTFADFMNSYNQALGGHVDYGLKPFIQTRTATAREQLMVNDMNPVVKYIYFPEAVPGVPFHVRAFVEDEDPAPSVRLRYRLNMGFTQFGEMYDDGGHDDFEAGDGYYGVMFGPLQPGDELLWQVSAGDEAGHTTVRPCEPFHVSLVPSTYPLLFINEFMASNDTILADENGEFDDWVEIYNGDDEPVWLGDKSLSGNLDNAGQWRFPDITLLPGQFLLVWCDGQEGQGALHASFKLSANGEEIGLYDAPSTGFALLDSVTFGPQTQNISRGRQTDGAPEWVFFAVPTPGSSNNPSGTGENPARGSLRVFPNPVHNVELRVNQAFSGKLLDLPGHVLWEGKNSRAIPVGNLPPGLYLLRSEAGECVKVVIL